MPRRLALSSSLSFVQVTVAASILINKTIAHAEKMARNSLLAPGVERLSRSKVFAKKALYKRIKKAAVAKPAAAAAPVATTKKVEVKGAKNGKTRVVPVAKSSKFYPAEDVSVPKKARKTARPTKLRASIVPGTVLVLLAGRHRGKRVVFLKQMEKSGLLLVTGPYKVNGVPLRRVNQAFVLATSTKVDVSGVKLPAHMDDAYFKAPTDKKAKKPTADGLFAKTVKAEHVVDAKKVADQKAVDATLVAAVKKVPQLKAYLGSSFSLKKGQAPHLLKF